MDTLWCLKLLVFIVIGLGHGNNWVISEIAETIMTDFYNYEKNKATDEDEKSLERGDARRQHIT